MCVLFNLKKSRLTRYSAETVRDRNCADDLAPFTITTALPESLLYSLGVVVERMNFYVNANKS